MVPCPIKIEPGQTGRAMAGLQTIPLKQIELHTRRLKDETVVSLKKAGRRPRPPARVRSGVEQPDRALIGRGGKAGIDPQGG